MNRGPRDFMLCLVGVNDSGRNEMKNELSYG